MSRPTPWRSVAVRTLVSGVVLGVLALTLDMDEIARRFGRADPRWILAALGVSVAQVALSAWRWRYTARRLGLRLPFREALREYYLATFLNQALPGGVLGDVSRAWRQARRGPSRASAARSVLLERASGQVVMLAGAGACAIALTMRLGLFSSVPWPSEPGVGVGVLAGGVALTGMVAMALRRGNPDPRARSWLPGRSRPVGDSGREANRRVVEAARALEGGPETPLGRLLRETWTEARRAFLHGRAFAVQLGTSLLVVASYVLVFVFACRAVGIETPLPTLGLLIPPVLVAMLIPVSLAGWGLREGAAAALWAAVGLPAAEGTAASVMYGVLVLVSSLPGALLLVRLSLEKKTRRGDPGRRGHPSRDERSDTGAGGPTPGSRWERG